MPDQTELEVLDDNLFVEALCLIAMEIYENNSSDYAHTSEEKLILFLHQLDQSEGPILIQKKLGVTRARNGFNWSLLHGLKSEKERILIKSKNERQDRSLLTFNSMINYEF